MRFLMLLLVVATVLCSRPAEALVLILPKEEGAPPLELRSLRQDVTVRGLTVEVTQRQTFYNPQGVDVEGTFLLTVPKGGQVSDFSLTVDGRTFAAEVLDQPRARQLYENIVRRLRDPGLLEYLDAQTIRARIYPIPRRSTVDVETRFVMPLRREGGFFLLRCEGPDPNRAPRPAESTLRVTLENDGGIGPVTSPTHELRTERSADRRQATITPAAEGPFFGAMTLLFGIEKKDLGLHLIAHRRPGDETGTFLLLIDPPSDDAKPQALPKDVVFVLDVSGSMADGNKITQALGALGQCLSALEPQDRFAVLTFATDVEAFREGLLPASAENIAAARTWIQERRARGGTNIHGALNAAAELLRSSADGRDLRQVVFMTDGLPTVGKTDQLSILTDFKAASAGTVRVFSVGFGYDVNTHLLDALSEDSGAVSDYIEPREDLELAVTTLFKAISQPVLADLRLTASGVELTELFPRELPLLFAGRDLLVLGTYKGSGKATLTLTGKARGRTHATELVVEFPKESDATTAPVRALWAGRKVAWLLDEIRRNGEAAELREEVTALAKEFRLVTPYTSFFAAPEEEYQRAEQEVSSSSRPSAPRADGFGGNKAGRLFSAPAPASVSGKAAVQYAEGLRARKEASFAPAEVPALQQSAASTRTTRAGKDFTRTAPSAPWQQAQGNTAGLPTVRIVYLSPAYFALATAWPELREVLALGERIEFAFRGQWIMIGPEGAQETLPDALKP